MTRHERALAEVARLRQVAQAATPGPWSDPLDKISRAGLRDDGGYVMDATHEVVAEAHVTCRDAAHIAAWSPSLVLPWLDAAETVLRLHDCTTYTCPECDQNGAPCRSVAPFLTLLAPSTEETS